MGEHNFEQNPVILYGFVLLMNAVCYFLVKLIIKNEGNNSHFAKAIGNDLKGKLSVVFYILGITFSFFRSEIGILLYAIVAFMWLIPDKKIEKMYYFFSYINFHSVFFRILIIILRWYSISL